MVLFTKTCDYTWGRVPRFWERGREKERGRDREGETLKGEMRAINFMRIIGNKTSFRI